jgi:DUF1707 SHOCT-like domain
VATGPGDSAGAGRGRLRAGHADRERVIEALKSAFVDGRLTKDELAERTGRALKARTYANLAALTADLPAESAVAGPAAVEPLPAVPAAVEASPAVPEPAEPAVAEPAATVPVPAVRWPMAKAAAISGVCLGVAVGAMRLAFYFDPGGAGPSPHHGWAQPCVLLAFISVMLAALALFLGAAVSIGQRRARRRLPPAPGPGGGALDAGQDGGTGQGPVPPGRRTDETQTDLRAHKLRQRGRRIPAQAGRALGGVRPAPGAA